MQKDEPTIIELDDDDCALVLKVDGSLELHAPNQDDDAEVMPHVQLLGAIAGGLATGHPAITALLDHQRSQIEAQRNNAAGAG